MTIRSYVVGQFKKPDGFIGRLAGWIMANRRSNIERNAATIIALDLDVEDYVLEIGCGPGIGLSNALKSVKSGKVVGVDHSPIMLDQAGKRNSSAINDGRLELRRGNFELMDFNGKSFNKIYSVNVIQFLAEPKRTFEKIYSLLKDGGLSVTTYMPRSKNPNREQAAKMAEKIHRYMNKAGFKNITIEELPLSPSPAVVVRGIRL